MSTDGIKMASLDYDTLLREANWEEQGIQIRRCEEHDLPELAQWGVAVVFDRKTYAVRMDPRHIDDGYTTMLMRWLDRDPLALNG